MCVYVCVSGASVCVCVRYVCVYIIVCMVSVSGTYVSVRASVRVYDSVHGECVQYVCECACVRASVCVYTSV